MALVTLESDLLARMAIYFAEIEGVKWAWPNPPANMLEVGDMPVFYFMVGPMLDAIPNDSPERALVSREFIARLVVGVYGGASGTNGGDIAVAAAPFYHRVRNKLLVYPRLQTLGTVAPNNTPLNEYGALANDITFADSGLAGQRGPGGLTYGVIDWRLTCTCYLDIPNSVLS